MFIPLIEILVNGLLDSFLLATVAAIGGATVVGMLIIGALYLVLKALKDIMRIIFGVPDPVVRRQYINNDGREVIEEIPYSPAMNMFNATTSTLKEITDGRSQH